MGDNRWNVVGEETSEDSAGMGGTSATGEQLMATATDKTGESI